MVSISLASQPSSWASLCDDVLCVFAHQFPANRNAVTVGVFSISHFTQTVLLLLYLNLAERYLFHLNYGKVPCSAGGRCTLLLRRPLEYMTVRHCSCYTTIYSTFPMYVTSLVEIASHHDLYILLLLLHTQHTVVLYVHLFFTHNTQSSTTVSMYCCTTFFFHVARHGATILPISPGISPCCYCYLYGTM